MISSHKYTIIEICREATTKTYCSIKLKTKLRNDVLKKQKPRLLLGDKS